MNDWPLHSALELAALPTAASCARLHAKHVLWEWRLEKLAEDAELIVSELVTNSVRAAAAPQQGGPQDVIAIPCVELRLYSDGNQVLIEIWDGNSQPPVPQRSGADGTPPLGDEGGRGVFMVEVLSQRWGYHATPAAPGQPVGAPPQSRAARGRRHEAGKVVWAVLA